MIPDIEIPSPSLSRSIQKLWINCGRYNQAKNVPHTRDSGKQAIFIRVGVKAYKFYFTKTGFLYTYYLQYFAWKHDLGPKPGICFIINNRLYGYETEIAEVYKSHTYFMENNLSAKLVRQYNRIGMSISDVQSFNCGMINNKPMLVDFGDCALISKDDESARFDWTNKQKEFIR
jgi:hypothetical protein